MRPERATRLSRFLVARHPRHWRERYAEEVLDVLDQYQPTGRTVLNLGISTVSTHLDPEWRGRLSLRAALQTPVGVFVATTMALLVLAAGCMGIGGWQDYKGNNGPPMPLSDGAFGMMFSPDGRLVAAINPNLEIWSVADPAHPIRLGYSRGDTAGAPAAFSPNGQILATSGQPGLLWNVTDPGAVARIATITSDSIGTGAVAFGPGGHVVAGAPTSGDTLALWSLP